jgi:hypothetical protein
MSEFDREAERLKLTPEQYQDSLELRAWAQRNKSWRFVPEDLLEAWGMATSACLGPSPHKRRPESKRPSVYNRAMAIEKLSNPIRYPHMTAFEVAAALGITAASVYQHSKIEQVLTNGGRKLWTTKSVLQVRVLAMRSKNPAKSCALTA